MKDALTTIVIVLVLTSAVLFAGYEWGKSSVRVRTEAHWDFYPVAVLVPGHTGAMPIKHDTVVTVVSNSTVVTVGEAPLLAPKISRWTWTAQDSLLTLWGTQDSVAYWIHPQKIDTNLALPDTSEYIEASSRWYEHWYLIPISVSLYIIGEHTIWKN